MTHGSYAMVLRLCGKEDAIVPCVLVDLGGDVSFNVPKTPPRRRIRRREGSRNGVAAGQLDAIGAGHVFQLFQLFQTSPLFFSALLNFQIHK